jgi:hypothetical protein
MPWFGNAHSGNFCRFVEAAAISAACSQPRARGRIFRRSAVEEFPSKPETLLTHFFD